MNKNPASDFIETVLGKNREVILEIVKNLFFSIHDLILNEFYIPKKNESLFKLKRSAELFDFSGAADLFRTPFYFNKRLPQKYNHVQKRDISQQTSLVQLKNKIRHLDDEFVREKIKGQIQNDYFNLNTIDQISGLVIDINTLRNREQHEFNNADFSQASLLFGYLNRLIALTPDHILESVNNYQEYLEFLNNEFKNLTKIYIPTEDEDETLNKVEIKPDIDIKGLAEKISEQIKKDDDSKNKDIEELKEKKDKEIEELKEKLDKNTPKNFYAYELKKAHYEHLFKEGAIEKDARGFFKVSKYADDKDALAFRWAIRPDCTSMWGGIGESSSVPVFYIPFGAVQDAYGHIYEFYDKNDPFFSSANMDEVWANLYMFSIEEIESSWGPFDEPLKVIRELSVTHSDENYTGEEWDAYERYGLVPMHERTEDHLTPRQIELVKEIEKRPPIVIPIKDWEYPEASYKVIESSKEISSRVTKHPEPQKDDLIKPTIETIIRKTRKETREQLLELRNKIYTIMTNHTVFDYWDNILSSKIIKNILNEGIFLSEDFKTADIKPGYIWKTASKQREEGYVKRDKESLELMDLQINQFWGEVQDITRNYFFDYDFIYNNKNKPWAKASLKYTERDYKENKNLYDEIFDYLNKSNSSIKKDSSPFNEFSLSFIKALKRNIDEFPDDDLTWEAVGDGYVIKKLRK